MADARRVASVWPSVLCCDGVCLCVSDRGSICRHFTQGGLMTGLIHHRGAVNVCNLATRLLSISHQNNELLNLLRHKNVRSNMDFLLLTHKTAVRSNVETDNV